MKQILTLILLVASMTVFAQGVKKTTPEKKQTPTIQTPALADSVVIKGEYRTDTAKVLAILYVEDGSLTWLKGFVIVRSFVPVGGQPLTTSEVLYNSKFEAIRQEDVYQVKQQNWQ